MIGCPLFRDSYGYQHVVLHITEDWRAVMEKVGSLLVDFSEPFDCLAFSLTVAKLAAY